MGVPKLFHSLIQQYHHNEATNPTGYNIIKPVIDNNLPTHFYLDFNGGIYQCIKPGVITEETLILHVVEYLELLCKCIPNLELIYIAFDGVAPLGKCAQQRVRRFHSVCRNNRTAKINERFGSDIDNGGNGRSGSGSGSGIDTNMFTPGTSFMYNLSLAIKRQIASGCGNDNSNANGSVFTGKKIFLSDTSIPGEGEHKLIHHIREGKHKAIDGTDEERELYGKEHNTVIYGMDGDLIFLALSLDLFNVFLFRESGEYGNLGKVYSNNSIVRNYLFMDIGELAEAIITNFKDCYGCSKIEGHEMRRRYIDDYIFLGMLLGNDFMPKTHWFSIAEGGYERLLSAYWQIHNHTEKFLVDARNGMAINTEMLCDLMYIVKEQEQEAVVGLFAKRKKAKIWIKEDMNERERQQMLVDFYPLQHLYVEQAIEPHRDGWRDRYYKICLHMENRKENRQMICQSFLKTLVWTFHYYFDECISWDWVYNFDYAPTWTDIYEELVLHKNINISGSNKLFHFGKSEPLDTQTVLFMVLPWNSRQFMAKDIVRKLSDEQCHMRIYFPKRYALNVAFHRYYHECTPIIYKMELSKVKKFIKECKLTEDELKRNLAGTLFIR
jgi:5'-3' exonuclease